MTSLFSRAKKTDRVAKEAADEHEKQELYAEIGRLTTPVKLAEKTGNSLSGAERLAGGTGEAVKASIGNRAGTAEQRRADALVVSAPLSQPGQDGIRHFVPP